MNKVVINLIPSKIYLTLASAVYLLCLFISWYYWHALWLSILINIVILILAYYFFPQHVLLIKNNSIKKITINDSHIFIEQKNKICKKYLYSIIYQSNFLVIINADKQQIIIFKDSTAEGSLSNLNCLFKIRTLN